jgi:hypothetical protein
VPRPGRDSGRPGRSAMHDRAVTLEQIRAVSSRNPICARPGLRRTRDSESSWQSACRMHIPTRRTGPESLRWRHTRARPRASLPSRRTPLDYPSPAARPGSRQSVLKSTRTLRTLRTLCARWAPFKVQTLHESLNRFISLGGNDHINMQQTGTGHEIRVTSRCKYHCGCNMKESESS